MYAYVSGNPIGLIDPSGRFGLQDVADGSAGFGDTITFGGTQWVREQLDVDEVNDCSGWYTVGEVGGEAWLLWAAQAPFTYLARAKYVASAAEIPAAAVAKYGDAVGPSAKWFFDKKGTWKAVLDGAGRTSKVFNWMAGVR